MLHRRLALLAVCAALVACANRTDSDQLSQGRTNLRTVPCAPNEAAVAGVAGVNKEARTVYVGDYAVVAVCHLETLLKIADRAQKPVTLFIEGVDTGNRATGIDLETGRLTFILDRNDANKELWQPLLYNPLFDPVATIRISVGLEGERPLPRVPRANTTLKLRKLYIDTFVMSLLGILAVAVVALIAYAYGSDLLRDGPSTGGHKQAFSLGRAQMAWWFLLIITGYAFIWLVTGDRDTIPPSLVALMGISAATGVAAVALGRNDVRRRVIDDEIARIDHAEKQLLRDIDDAAHRAQRRGRLGEIAADLQRVLESRREELEEMRARLVANRAGLTSVIPSRGFIRDLITGDDGSVALDRFQIVVWTVVLGAIFLSRVLWDLVMPDFNATLLALLGISSGTYIGFKLPSKEPGPQ